MFSKISTKKQLLPSLILLLGLFIVSPLIKTNVAEAVITYNYQQIQQGPGGTGDLKYKQEIFQVTGSTPPEPTILTLNRSVYIWSTAMVNYGAEYIENYLTNNNITTAMVSLTNSSKPIVKQLLKDLPGQGKEVQLLIGSNSLLTNTNPNVYYDNLLNKLTIDEQRSISGLHLDVEPASSAFPDYHDREQYYQDLYIDLLVKTRIYTNQKGMRLFVDIPVSYPPQTLQRIYALTDKVYVMAYQITNMNYLETKVSDEMSQGKQKTVIAFRANDFQNRQEFEIYLSNASSKLGTAEFAMHDLTRFANLDKLP